MTQKIVTAALLVFSCTISLVAMAQTKPVWGWAKTLSGSGSDGGSLAADGRNGLYCYGSTSSDTLRSAGQSLVGGPGTDIFLIKYDTLGTVQWTKRFGNGGSNNSAAAIITDRNSNILVSGTFSGTLNIDGISLTSTGARDIFIAKFRPNGTIVWARQFTGNADDYPGQMLCDAQFNIYMVGSYYSTNFAIGATGLANANTYNFFYCRMDSSGNAVWAKKASTSAYSGFYDIESTGDGQITFVGTLQSGANLNFDPMVVIGGLTSSYQSTFFLRTDAAGNYISQGIAIGGRYSGSNTALMKPDKIVFGGTYTYLSLPPSAVTQLYNYNSLASLTAAYPGVQNGNSHGGSVMVDNQKRVYQNFTAIGTMSLGSGLSITFPDFVSVIWEMDSALRPQHLLPTRYQAGFSAFLSSLTVDTTTGNVYGTCGINKSTPGGNYQLGSNSLAYNNSHDVIIFQIARVPVGPALKALAGNDTTVCVGDSIFIGHPSGAVGGNPPYTYSWSPATNVASPTAAYTKARPSASGSYILTVTDSYGFFTKDTVAVTVRARPAAPSITISGSSSICLGDSTTLICSSPSGSGTYYFDWYRGGTFVQRLVDNPNFRVGTSGAYTVMVTEAGAPCASSASPPVTITATALNIGADTTIYQNCYNDLTNLLPLYNTAGLTAVWNTATPQAVPPGVYRLIVNNAGNCVDTAVVTIKLEVATWTGAVSSDWHTPGNWNINKVPTAITHVIINTGTPNSCVLSFSDAAVASLQLRNGASLTMANGTQITVLGNCAVLPPG
jgi:hypothetical protein